MTDYPNRGNNFQPGGFTPAQLAMYERVARQVWARMNKEPWEAARDKWDACYRRAAVILETIQDAGYEIVSRDAPIDILVTVESSEGEPDLVQDEALKVAASYFTQPARVYVRRNTIHGRKNGAFETRVLLSVAEGAVGRLSPEDVESDRKAGSDVG